MDRRGFIGALSAFAAAPVVGAMSADPKPSDSKKPEAIPVEPADGKRFILGIATASVSAGDFVQVQTYGPATVTVK